VICRLRLPVPEPAGAAPHFPVAHSAAALA